MSQSSLARFIVPNSATFAMKAGMVSKFEDLVYTGLIAQELVLAQDYLSGPAAYGHQDTLHPMGVTTPRVRTKDIFEQYKKVEAPVSMSVNGTIWMFDLSHRLIGMDKLDFARMRWAIDLMEATRSLHKVMDGFPVAAESVPDSDAFTSLRKIDRDADFDAVVLLLRQWQCWAVMCSIRGLLQ